MSGPERAADWLAEWAVRGSAALPQSVVDVLGRAHPLLALINGLSPCPLHCPRRASSGPEKDATRGRSLAAAG